MKFFRKIKKKISAMGMTFFNSYIWMGKNIRLNRENSGCSVFVAILISLLSLSCSIN